MEKVIYVNIESERLRRGMSKYELAKEVGITSRSYYNYIHGNVPIPSSVLLAFSKIFNCSIDYLLNWDRR